VWDKVYQKLTDFEEEIWLLRAVESTAAFFNLEIENAEQLRFVFVFNVLETSRLEVVPGAYGRACFRTQLGFTYLYLAIEGHEPEFRRQVVASVGHLTALVPKATNDLIRAGLMAYIARRRTSVPKNQKTSEDEKPAVNKQPRLLAFLAASAAFGDGAELTLREQLLSKLVVLAHHPEICECFASYNEIRGSHRAPGGISRQVWIDLCHRARLDPRAVLDNQLDHLLNVIMNPSSESKVFNEY